MNNFIFNNPTKVIFRQDAELVAGKCLQEIGCKKVLIHYGQASAVRSGLVGRVKNVIAESGIEVFELGGVIANPLLSKVYEGIELVREHDIDTILAIGGGSVIDSAKAIGMGACYDGDVWDFYTGKADPKKSLSIASILTIAAAGSEMSNASVITKDEGLLKRASHFDGSICKFSLLNPALTLTLPDYQTASGCVDILMHTMERYFNRGENMQVTDSVAEAIMSSIMRGAVELKSNPNNLEARADVMWTGALSHNGLTGYGTNGGDWSSHAIEHEISGLFNVAHGAGLSAVWGSWARYVVDAIPARFAKYATNVLNIAPLASQIDTALAGIAKTEEFFKSIDMPISISGLGIEVSDEQILEMAKSATRNDTIKIGNAKALSASDVAIIYKNAR